MLNNFEEPTLTVSCIPDIVLTSDVEVEGNWSEWEKTNNTNFE